MAADESLLEVEDERILRGFIKLQGHIRGILMRRALQEIRKDYEEIVADIEGDLTVHWPSNSLGLPTLKKGRSGLSNGVSGNKDIRPGRTGEETIPLTKQGQISVSREMESTPLPTPSRHESHLSQCNSEIFSCNSKRVDCFQVTERDGRKDASSSNSCLKLVSKCKPSVESQSCQADIPAWWSQEDAEGHVKPWDICVSKEVQTDVIGDQEIDQIIPERLKDSTLTQHPPENSDVLLIKPSGFPGMSPDWNREDLNLESRDGGELQCSSDKEQVCVPFATLSTTNQLKPGVKNGASKATIEGESVRTESENESKDQLVVDLDEDEIQGDLVRCSGEIDDEVRKPVNEGSHAKPEIGADMGEDADTDLPKNRNELLKLKGTMAMELLWIEQAIFSRKNYLRLKHQLS